MQTQLFPFNNEPPRKRMPPINRPNINDFFSVNRFLYHILIENEKPTLQSVSQSLGMSTSFLRDHLIIAYYPSSMKTLRSLALKATVNPDPPLVYKLINSNVILDFRAIELFDPITYFHFDHFKILEHKIK